MVSQHRYLSFRAWGHFEPLPLLEKRLCLFVAYLVDILLVNSS